MRSRRSVTVVISAVVASSALAACGASGSAQPRSSSAALAASADSAAAAAATAAYHSWVVHQVAELSTASRRFTDAVRAGDLARAKALYAPARYHYETIEPVAESFGDLDPAIDARIDDVASPRDWTGFHRLEQLLWVAGTTRGATSLANRLDADIARLRALVVTESYQPAQLANGATSLLDEIARSKVTGEEDRYSHTDLSDFAANLAGSQEAFTLVEPLLAAKDPQLATTVRKRFAEAARSLAAYRSGSGWQPYTAVDAAARRRLAQQVDALAEPLSQVAALVV
ncbi:MAG TPA: iron uptake system protein EfeO [Actinomycetes bacterium]|nr:iron uptake system protein EfeO [Actinomycetes bacterium]